PLNDENWVAWKGQITPMLELNGVWTHCDGAEVAPPPEEIEWCKEWDTAERVMWILISNNLSAAQFVHVSEAGTVKQMWDNLKAVHEHHGQQSILAIRHTLYQSCTQDGDDIITHLMTLRLLQVQLHYMGSKVPDQDFTNILLSSLPKSWDSFTTSYLGSQMGANILTSQQFIAIICNECNRQKAANGGINGMETILMAQSLKHPAKKKKAADKEKKRACFTCGRNSHLAKDCFFKGKLNTGKGKEKRAKQQSPRACLPKTGNAARSNMEDGMYVTHNKGISDCADIDVNSWLADSAVSLHLSNQCDMFKEFTPLNRTIQGVGNMDIPVKGRGMMRLKSWTDKQNYVIVLQDVLYVPQAPNSLLSIPHLDKSGRHADMGDGCIHLYDKNETLITVGWKVKRMYLLNVTAYTALKWVALLMEMTNTWLDWHCQFRHIGVSGLQHTLSKCLVTGIMVTKNNSLKFDCDACTQAKQAWAPFPCQSESRAEQPGDLTHTDLWECRMTGIHGVKYFISFIDDCSRCIVVEFLKTKDQAIEKFQNYMAYLKCQYSMSPKNI
ncbi:hypothetical protein SCLCIDRAFT_112267, partial [Scleroderma citrinum Foug A]